MGLFDKAVDKAVEKKLNQLKATSPYEYDSLIVPNLKDTLRDRFTRNMFINGVWYRGNDIELKRLYERDLKAFRFGGIQSDELNYFWGQVTTDTNIRKIHSGLPQRISEAMVDLIRSNGHETAIYLDDEETERDEENEKRLQAILDDNDFDSLFNEAIETESWGGGVAFKLSYNERFPYPIIEVIQPDEYEPTIQAGRIIEDKFITYFNRKNTTYKLKEIYGFDEGGSYINYELYALYGEDWRSVPITEIEETRNLKDVRVPGVFEKFSLYKPNKLPNNEFRGSKLGESDYAGSHGLFDALDEVLSTMIQEFRDGKIKNFWPDNLLPKDPTTQMTYLPPSLKKDFIVYAGAVGEREKPTMLEQKQGEIHSEKYLETYKKLIESILNNAGLSPQTIGVTGLESTAASEASQELREKTSIRTRDRKCNLWKMTLQKLCELALKMDDIKNGQTVGDYAVKVTFNDYKIQTIEDKTKIASQGILSKTWDIRSAVDYIHDEMTDEERILMVVRIKIENGINVFTREEEAVYKKFIAEVEEEPEMEEAEAFDEIEEDMETDESEDVDVEGDDE